VDLPPDVARLANQAVYMGGDAIGEFGSKMRGVGLSWRGSSVGLNSPASPSARSAVPHLERIQVLMWQLVASQPGSGSAWLTLRFGHKLWYLNVPLGLQAAWPE
jgi:hypothetical protein